MFTINSSFRKACSSRLWSFIKDGVVGLIVILLNSCAPIYYAPNTSNIPLLKEKGEARLNTYYSATDYTSGAEVQGALAVSKNVGVMLNTAFLDGGEDGNGYLVEGGAGYYKPFAEKWVFESYGGLGFGSANNNNSFEGTSKVNFTKCFVQPSLGFTSKYFEIGIASRFSAIFMNVRDYNPENSSYSLEYVRAHPNSYLWEPSGFIGFGVQAIKLRLQLTISENINNKELSQEETIFAVGLTFDIKPKKK